MTAPLSQATNSAPSFWLSGDRWQEQQADENYILAAQQRYGVGEIVARLLNQRHVPLEEIDAYLAPSLRDLMPDPLHLKGMAEAIERLRNAILQDEMIGIFGDYDVDGATSSAILKRYITACGGRCAVHIPDRQKEGYGPNLYGFQKLRDAGATLIVTVDTGALAHQVLADAKADGFEVIVLDHHQGEPTLPEAVAVVNPNRFDETTALTYLAAVGVTFLALVALHSTLREAGYFTPTRPEPDLRWLLDIVALGTICDVVPLTGLNRAFVVQGLKIMAQHRNIGMAALFDVAAVDETPNPYHCGFVLGPRINAGGRVGKADLGTRLLTCEDPEQARQIAQQLDHYNQERRAIEAAVLEAAMAQAEAQLNANPNTPMLFALGEGWHEGVIGIVAGRVKEKFNLPSAVITFNVQGMGKASARSVSGVDMGQMVIAARQAGLLEAGGGHAMAAGFSVTAEKNEAFMQFAREKLAPKVATYQQDHIRHYAATLPLTAASVELAEAIEQVGPYGAGNAAPRFCFSGLQLVKADIIGKTQEHLRLIFTEPKADTLRSAQSLKVMSFGTAQTDFGQELLSRKGQRFDVIGRLKREEWQGRVSLSLMLEDARLIHA